MAIRRKKASIKRSRTSAGKRAKSVRRKAAPKKAARKKVARRATRKAVGKKGGGRGSAIVRFARKVRQAAAKKARKQVRALGEAVRDLKAASPLGGEDDYQP